MTDPLLHNPVWYHRRTLKASTGTHLYDLSLLGRCPSLAARVCVWVVSVLHTNRSDLKVGQLDLVALSIIFAMYMLLPCLVIHVMFVTAKSTMYCCCQFVHHCMSIRHILKKSAGRFLRGNFSKKFWGWRGQNISFENFVRCTI